MARPEPLAEGERGRSRVVVEAERRIPQWLRDATSEVREFHAATLDRDADQVEATASNLRSKARALRVYNRRLAMDMPVTSAPYDNAESFYPRALGAEGAG